jgi:DNA-binding NtrC family response regulator
MRKIGVQKKPVILVVDDESIMSRQLEEKLGEKYDICTAATWSEGETLLNKDKPDLIVLDLCLDDISDLDALKIIRRSGLDTPVVIVTAYGSIQNAVEAMKYGAQDYIEKPFEFEKMEDTIDNILANSKAHSKDVVEMEIEESENGSGIIYKSLQMKQLLETARRAAKSNANVMLLGDSGTGKELFAREIHRCSYRADGPFVVINCAAVPENLLESELFGYEKGAFTGAGSRKIGKLELANGGTVFLDELGDMPLLLQGKLLRAIEQLQIERLGGTELLDIKIRIVCATNQELENLIEEGRFRSDLYYRLAVIPISIPPLKERIEDIEVLADYFLTRFNKLHQRNFLGISAEALSILNNHDWPGNVRELKNVIERAVVLYDGPYLEPQHLPLRNKKSSPSASKSDWTQRKAEFERKEICSALHIFKGNRTKTAQHLSMSTRNLQLKIKKYKINPEDYQ